jgi:hypothetical protein
LNLLAIAKFKKCKSPDSDQIPAELIHAGNDALVLVFHKLISSIWNKEKLLDQWKESVTAPIQNKGNNTDCNNYHGVSLLSASYKILLNSLLSRLSSCMDEIIGDHQCWFRHNRSTTNQIFCIHQILEKQLEYSEKVHQLFVDLY